jgi:hypothetical protein
MVFSRLARSRTTAVIGGAALLVTLGGVGGAVASGQIGSSDIRDGSVRTVDIHDQAVTGAKLAPGVLARFVHQLEADGPYPGLTQLQQGHNSTKLWVGDEGATLQQSWVQCAPGKVALGGGFGQSDGGPDVIKNIQIVTSVPATYKAGVLVDTPIKGDPDMSIRPNAWLVEGFNLNAAGTDVSVRPWVVCAVMR